MKRDKEEKTVQRQYDYLVYIQFEKSTKQYSFGSNTQYHAGQKVVVETIREKNLVQFVKPAFLLTKKNQRGM